jgi:periplasmic protein TonB
MFNELLESTLVKKNTNKRWTMVLSALVQTVILGVLVLVPLIHTEALPQKMLAILLVAPPAPPPPPPHPASPTGARRVRVIRSEALRQPSFVPTIAAVLTDPEPLLDVIDDTPTNSVFRDIAGQGIIAGNNPSLPPPPRPAAPVRIKQGGVVTAASILSQTRPVYPALARQARIQGSVVLHAIIGRDGRVAQLEVISGHPLLVQAALDAVKQWLYKPTLLNGDAVEVDTTITVTFLMGN